MRSVETVTAMTSPSNERITATVCKVTIRGMVVHIKPYHSIVPVLVLSRRSNTGCHRLLFFADEIA